MPTTVDDAMDEITVSRPRRTDLKCRDCSKYFSKPEHLRRHARVHSGAKPFTCPELGCSRRFNRPDSLLRHRRTHGEAQTASLDQTVATPALSDDPPVLSPSEALSLQTPVSAEHDFANTDQHLDLDFTSSLPNDLLSFDNDPLNSYLDSSWPDPEQLFSFLTTDLQSTSVGFGLFDTTPTSISLEPLPPANPRPADDVEPASSHSHRALHVLGSLLDDFTKELSRVRGIGITSEMLDTCLGCFFSQFLPVFPFIHEPTFTLKKCSPPLLLNIIAIGSLFIAAEDEKATTMGESLWKVSHAVVATSWQRLLAKSTDANASSTDLVLTTLLSQAYAVLSSNHSLRLSSHAFRGMTLAWAIPHDSSPSPPPSSTQDTLSLEARWKRWASSEVRRRAHLGHYVLDGLMSQSSGLPNSARHTVNNVPLPCSDEVFSAPNAETWSRLYQPDSHSHNPGFRELLLRLFNPDQDDAVWSHMTIPILMEAIQSLISESQQACGPSLGMPDDAALGRALWRLWNTQINIPQRPAVDTIDLGIRWHVVCISLLVEPRSLVFALCKKYNIKQELYSGQNAPSVKAFDLEEWTQSHLARRALLHALAVCDQILKLSYSNLKALHLPFAVYTAAMVLVATTSAGHLYRMRVPEMVDWEQVCSIQNEPLVVDNPGGSPDIDTTSGFIFPSASSSAAILQTQRGRMRNLLVEINNLQTLLRSFTWSISGVLRRDLGNIIAAQQAAAEVRRSTEQTTNP